MSEDSPSPPPGHHKQRKSNRSCDICRQRKIRCDGPSKPVGVQCSNCLPFNSPCTYLQPSRKRGPKPKSKSIEELKQRITDLEAQLRISSVCSLCSQPLEGIRSSSLSVFKHSPESDATGDSSSSTDDVPVEENFSPDELAERFNQISLSGKHKFFGPGSSFALVINTIAVKEQLLGPNPWPRQLTRRSLYFDIPPWEQKSYERRPYYIFPPDDLKENLIDLYFANVHPTFPVLHEQNFRREVSENLHLKNTKFGGTVLAVMAIASWYSNDPRVFIGGSGNTLSSGWKYAAQIEAIAKPFEPTVHEVQLYAIMALFTLSTSAPQMSWLYLGLGIRFLQQRGEMLRKRKTITNVEDELWNRAFWSLFVLDRIVCNFLGRTTTITDYDVDLPLEVDDEYWETGFTQPLGKPSRLSYWVHFVQLCDILGETLRQLYASNRWKIRMGWTGPDWEMNAVMKLDSDMNNLLSSLPSHLRWDPDREGVFLEQSAALHVTYYHIQITIHRRYIHKPSALAVPSLSMCTAAARSSLHISDLWMSKFQRIALIYFHNSVLAAGAILLFNIFAKQRAGLPVTPAKDLELVGAGLHILKVSESRSQPAGRIWDILNDLQSLRHPLYPSAPRKEPQPPPAQTPTSITDVPSIFVQYPGHPQTILSGAAEFYPQHDQGQPFAPGTSIEQLLAETSSGDPNPTSWSVPLPLESGIFDDEAMSMWMAAPADFSNLGQWDEYIENMTGIETSGLS